MTLFFKILLTMFIAEMGDKTQLLLVAMTSRFQLRDIILGSAAAILVLNGLAVGVGSLISRLIPGYLIKIIAALAFFFFAWSSLAGDGGEEENSGGKESKLPVLTVFATFFVAELGDKTQLTAITFAANEGLSHAVSIWLACSIGPVRRRHCRYAGGLPAQEQDSGRLPEPVGLSHFCRLWLHHAAGGLWPALRCGELPALGDHRDGSCDFRRPLPLDGPVQTEGSEKVAGGMTLSKAALPFQAALVRQKAHCYFLH